MPDIEEAAIIKALNLMCLVAVTLVLLPAAVMVANEYSAWPYISIAALTAMIWTAIKRKRRTYTNEINRNSTQNGPIK